MKRCIIIFAKEPQKGRVKTRLSGHLSQAASVRLYKAFLKDTVDIVRNVCCEQRIMAYDSDTKNPAYLRKVACHFLFYRQKGRGLGRKMYDAFEFARGINASRTVIIGSDSPTLPRAFIEEAFKKLGRNDVVVGPGRDGGYYLIGLKKPFWGLFKGVRWSSDKVLDMTIENLRRFKRRVAMLDRWYDVDERESLDYLKCDLRRNWKKDTAKWTKRALGI